MNHFVQKFKITFVTIITLWILHFSSIIAVAQFAGGDGTTDDPWQVATLEQLDSVRYYLNRNFIQIADIDATETADWDDGKGFEPIGNNNTRFTGTYDGDNFKILHIKIHRENDRNVGLFGYTRAGDRIQIQNVALENVSIFGGAEVGGLIGTMEGGTVRNTYVTGTVSGNGSVGGLIGRNIFEGKVYDSYTNTSVTGTVNVGGFIGTNRFSEIINSSASGDVTGLERVGGFIGDNVNGTLVHSHAAGHVSGDDFIGGLIGRATDSFTQFSYASGNVSGMNSVGGLIGQNRLDETFTEFSYATGDVSGVFQVGGLIGSHTNGDLQYSYSHGSVTGEERVGGLIGRNLGNVYQVYSSGEVIGDTDTGGLIGLFDGVTAINYAVTAAYWNMETSGLTHAVGTGIQGQTKGLTTAMMTGQEAYMNLYRLDFNEIWQLTLNYPVLAWQEPEDAQDQPTAAIIIPEPEDWDFGEVEVNQPVTQVFSLANFGNVSMSGVVTLSNTYDGVFEIIQGEGPWSLEPDSSMILEVVFHPDREDTFQTFLEISHNAANEDSPLHVLIDGAGVILQFAGGSGTETDPYQVSTLWELHKVRYFPDAWFIQTADIDAAPTTDWNNGKGFDPIGWWVENDINEPFTGVFDGNGYEIANLVINRPNENSVGLFGFTLNAVLRNMSLISGNVTGARDTGSLIGRGFGTTIVDNCSSTADVTGNSGVGGLVGFIFWGEINDSYATGNVSGRTFTGGLLGTLADNGIVKNSHATGEVSGIRDGIGGLVGYSLGDVHNSYATGNISGEEVVGGLAGLMAGTLLGSYATGNASGDHRIGGLVGQLNGVVNYSYAKGDVTGEEFVGGLIGLNKGVVMESYSTGSVNGQDGAGGVVGDFEGTRTSAYWDIESSGMTRAVGKGDQGETIGLTTAQMSGAAAADNMTNLAFGERWVTIADDYPRHFWEYLLGIPYFKLSVPEINVSILEGHTFELTIAIENIGGVAGTQTIELRGAENQLIDSRQNLSLEAGNRESVILNWQTDPGDQGEYSFTVISENDTVALSVSVLVPPAHVMLEFPDVESTEVDVSTEFIWRASDNSEIYDFQLSTNEEFTALVKDSTGISGTTLGLPDALESLTQYWWRIRGVNKGGQGDWSESWSFTTMFWTSTTPETNEIPLEVTLRQNYPNPFNPSTIIRFGLPEQSDVMLEVFNVTGQRVARLVNEVKYAGWHDVTFDASSLASGVYIYRLQTGTHVESKRLILIK